MEKKVKKLSYSITWPTNVATGNKLDPKNKKIAVICGIAEPYRFMTMVTRVGVKIDYKIIVGDHKSFTAKLFAQICIRDTLFVTTEKDYYRNKKLFTLLKLNIYLVKLQINKKQIEVVYNKIIHGKVI